MAELPDVVVRERTVEASGSFGEFVDRQLERARGGRNHLRRDVAENVADGVHVEVLDREIPVFLFHGVCVCVMRKGLAPLYMSECICRWASAGRIPVVE